MKQIFKIALPGYNASTDTDPNHFSLFVDQQVDYILIKEKTRSTTTVNAHSSVTIAHNLGYVPLCFVFAEITSGTWYKLFGAAFGGGNEFYTIDSTNLVLRNDSGAAKTFSYYIFYDNAT